MSEQISRRGFLRLFGAAAATAAAPTYFLPPIGGWKSETIIHPYGFGVGYRVTMNVGPPPVFYSKIFIDNLRRQLPFKQIARAPEMPTPSGLIVFGKWEDEL